MAGSIMLVGFDVALFDLDVELLQAKPIGDALAADGDEQPLTVDGLALLAGLHRHRHLAVRLLERVGLELSARQHRDAALAENLGELLPDIGVFERQQCGEKFDQGHLRAVPVVDAGELSADRASAHDDDRLRHLVQGDSMVAVDDPIAIHLETGQRLGTRSGGDHQVLRIDCLAAVLDHDLVFRLDDAFALKDRDLVLLEQELRAAPELVDHSLLPLQHRRPIDLPALGLDAERGGTMDLVSQLRGMEERFGGNAAAVQAGAAHLLFLDDCDLESQLGSSNSTDIPGGAAADDGYVKRLIGHTQRLYPATRGSPNSPAASARRQAGGPWRNRSASGRPRTRPGHWVASPSCRE